MKLILRINSFSKSQSVWNQNKTHNLTFTKGAFNLFEEMKKKCRKIERSPFKSMIKFCSEKVVYSKIS